MMDFLIATNLRIRHKVENNRIMRGWGYTSLALEKDIAMVLTIQE